MEKKKLFLLTLTGGKEEKAYLGALEKYVIKHKNKNDNIYVKTIYDDMIVLHDIEKFEEILPFTKEEVTEIAKYYNWSIEDTKEKLSNSEYKEFENLEDYLKYELKGLNSELVIDYIVDLLHPSYNNLTLKERVEEYFDDVFMFDDERIIKMIID